MKQPPDLLAGWTIHRCDNGTYDAMGPRTGDDVHYGYDFHNLGNGRTALSAWVELFDLLSERYEDDKRERAEAAEQELEDLDKHCPTCTCGDHP